MQCNYISTGMALTMSEWERTKKKEETMTVNLSCQDNSKRQQTHETNLIISSCLVSHLMDTLFSAICSVVELHEMSALLYSLSVK